jgi:uncharacterized membrane protein (UPF0127 family)
MKSFLNPLLRAPGIEHVLENATTGEVVARHLLTAFDSKDRRQGLLGRDSLPESTAILIAPSNAVHTFFMRFAIDIAFVARDGRVIKVRSSVPPWRIAVAVRAFAVVELAAGALARSRTGRGDTLICHAVPPPPDRSIAS